jgi:hypothetical protein
MGAAARIVNGLLLWASVCLIVLAGWLELR